MSPAKNKKLLQAINSHISRGKPSEELKTFMQTIDIDRFLTLAIVFQEPDQPFVLHRLGYFFVKLASTWARDGLVTLEQQQEWNSYWGITSVIAEQELAIEKPALEVDAFSYLEPLFHFGIEDVEAAERVAQIM